MEHGLSLTFPFGKAKLSVILFPVSTLPMCKKLQGSWRIALCNPVIFEFFTCIPAYCFSFSFVLGSVFSHHDRLQKTGTTDFHDAPTWQLQLKMTGYCKFSCSTFFLQVPEVFSAKLSCPCRDIPRFVPPLQGKEPLYHVPICKDSLCQRSAIGQKRLVTAAAAYGWL